MAWSAAAMATVLMVAYVLVVMQSVQRGEQLRQRFAADQPRSVIVIAQDAR